MVLLLCKIPPILICFHLVSTCPIVLSSFAVFNTFKKKEKEEISSIIARIVEQRGKQVFGMQINTDKNHCFLVQTNQSN